MTSFSPYAMRQELPWLKDKIWAGMPLNTGKWNKKVEDLEPVVKKVVDIMAEHGISNEIVGLDGCSSELLMQEAFGNKKIDVVDAKRAMLEARTIKSQDEIECMRIAASMAEAAFADIAAAIRPGLTECELMGIGMKTLYSLGADETQEFVVASGPRTNPLHIDFTDRQIRPGDLVIVDINGNSFHGYKSCYYRTFCCGKASEEQKEIYEENRDMIYAGMSAVKAGNTTLDICEKWPTSASYWGYDKWDDVFGYAVGHGLGISLHEFPVISYPISKAEPIRLEEGMVMAVETWTGKKGGKNGVRLEEEVVVTKDGYDLLTKFPVDQITECWN
jgi:Xaa-Pro dipeptidase